MSSKPRDFKIVLSGVIVTLLAILLTVLYAFTRKFDGISFVTDRPDLSSGCGNHACDVWVYDHAADFVPLKKAQALKIAVVQDAMAPAPGTMLIQFTLSPDELKDYLREKQRLTQSIHSILTEATNRWQVDTFPFNRLAWWPPRPDSTLEVYSARSPRGNMDYYVLVQAPDGQVTVLANASRGR